MIANSHMTEETVYATERSAVSFCNSTERFALHFNDEVIEFRFCEFISYRKKILDIDMARLLLEDLADVEIVHLPHCDRIFAYSIGDILELRDILGGTFAMMELNSVIHQAILRKGF